MKVFEDYFSELQTDMVEICLEYVDNFVDDIYIYCSYEPEMYVFDFFYTLNGETIHKHQLNSVSSTHEYDVSRERQRAALKIGNDNLKEIHKKFKEYKREMPTEMKLHYNVKQNSLNANYRYDLIYSNDEILLPNDIFSEWFKEVKEKQV
jgi:hypothetical protein